MWYTKYKYFHPLIHHNPLILNYYYAYLSVAESHCSFSTGFQQDLGQTTALYTNLKPTKGEYIMANGLGTPIKKETETDILATTRKAFGKLNATPPTLEQRLQSLSETELGTTLQTAQFVKLAHGFGSRVGNTQA